MEQRRTPPKDAETGSCAGWGDGPMAPFCQRLEGFLGRQRSRKEFDRNVILRPERYQKLLWNFLQYDGRLYGPGSYLARTGRNPHRLAKSEDA
jgi:hypothetical protein